MSVILYIALSADGYIADEHGDVTWLEYAHTNTDEDYGYHTFLKTIDVVIMGETSYKQVLSFGEWPYAHKYTYVFSRDEKPHTQIEQGSNRVEFVAGDVQQILRDVIAAHPQSRIWLFGGADLVTQFYNAHLIDEYVLTILPVQLGKGIRLPEGILQEQRMHFVEQLIYPKNIVQKHYVKK